MPHLGSHVRNVMEVVAGVFRPIVDDLIHPNDGSIDRVFLALVDGRLQESPKEAATVGEKGARLGGR